MIKDLEDGLYIINGKKILYFQDGEFWKPIKYAGRYSGNIQKLDKQHKVIKSIEKI